MRHARADYDRIQDPARLIPENEPVFLLRGQDRNAAAAVRHYAALVRMNAPPGGEAEAQRIAEASEKQAARMDVWPKKKNPDMPKDPAP